MKNFFIILLTLFYSATSSGMVWQLHQCMEEVFLSVGAEEGACGICKTNGKKDCCKSELKLVKTDLSQKANSFLFKMMAQPAAVPAVFSFVLPGTLAKVNLDFIQINAPPNLHRLALFVIHCNYRI